MASVQERTAQYIAAKGRELVALICENEGATLQGVVDASTLKYKHRDELENIFKSWGERVPFDGARCRRPLGSGGGGEGRPLI